jgi:hypothetical protein
MLPRTAAHCSSVRSIDEGTNTFFVRWKYPSERWSNLDHLRHDRVIGCVLDPVVAPLPDPVPEEAPGPSSLDPHEAPAKGTANRNAIGNARTRDLFIFSPSSPIELDDR